MKLKTSITLSDEILRAIDQHIGEYKSRSEFLEIAARKLIIQLARKEATDLLFKIYDKAEIKKQVEEPLPGEWSDKSLNYWSLLFDIQPQPTKYVLRHLG